MRRAPAHLRLIQPRGLEQDEGGESARLLATQMDYPGIVLCRRGELQLDGRARRIGPHLNLHREFVYQSHAVALLTRRPLHESCQSWKRADARGWAVTCAERAAGSWAGVSEVGQLRLKMGRSSLPPDGQHDAKTRLAAHHPLVGLGGALEREGLVHRPHPGTRAEGERLLRVDRRPRGPPLDRAET